MDSFTTPIRGPESFATFNSSLEQNKDKWNERASTLFNIIGDLDHQNDNNKKTLTKLQAENMEARNKLQNYSEKLDKVKSAKIPKEHSNVDESFRRDTMKQKKKDKAKALSSEIKSLEQATSENQAQIQELESRILNNEIIKSALLKTIEYEMQNINNQANNQNNIQLLLEIENQKKTINQLNSQLQSYQTESDVTKKYSQHLQESFTETKVNYEQLKQENYTIKQENERLKKKIHENNVVQQSSNKQNEEMINDLRGKNQKLIQLLTNYKDKQKELQNEIIELQTQLKDFEDTRQQLEESNQIIKSKSDEISRKDAIIADMSLKINDLEQKTNELDSTNQKVDQLQSVLMNQGNDINAKKSYINQLEAKIALLQKQLNTLQSSYNLLNDNCEYLTKTNQSLTKDLNDSLTQNAEGSVIEAQYEQLQNDVEKYKRQISSQNTQIQMLISEKTKLSAIIKDKDNEIYLNSLKIDNLESQLRQYDEHVKRTTSLIESVTPIKSNMSYSPNTMKTPYSYGYTNSYTNSNSMY